MAICTSSIVALAKREAEKSNFHIRLGAVIHRKKEIISVGYNKQFINCPRVPNKYKRFPTSAHAEVSAIINARTDLRGATLTVVRINRKGKLMFSLPCDFCFQYIAYVGIRNVVYINKEGRVDFLRV